MDHIPSIVEVYQTKDYSRFSSLTGNRVLNDGKIKRIIKEIESGNDMLQYYPIQVRVKDDKLSVLDGQHRLKISKLLLRPVYYIIVKEPKSMADIAKVNSNVEKWKARDFINCYAQQGNEHYINLQKFIDMFGFGISQSIKMLANGNPGVEGHDAKIMEAFQTGDFQVKHMTEACGLADEVKKFEKFAHWRDRAFVIAIARVINVKKVTVDDLLAAFLKRPEKLVKQASYKEYIVNLETIYNLGKQIRVVIL